MVSTLSWEILHKFNRWDFVNLWAVSVNLKPLPLANMPLLPHVDLAIRRMIAMDVPKDSWLHSSLQTEMNEGIRTILVVESHSFTFVSPVSPSQLLRSELLRSAKEFILVVILTAFLEIPGWENNEGLHLVEFFAGVANPSRLAHWCGLKSRAFELLYCPLKNRTKKKRNKFRRSPMDMNGAAGMVFLDGNHIEPPKVRNCF